MEQDSDRDPVREAMGHGTSRIRQVAPGWPDGWNWITRR